MTSKITRNSLQTFIALSLHRLERLKTRLPLLLLKTSLWGFVILALLRILKAINLHREPKWFREVPEVAPPTLWSAITGTVLHYVRQGDICRTFCTIDVPDYLRFTNGLGAGLIRDFVLIKTPRIAKAILLEKNTAKPVNGYRSFKRLTRYMGTIDFLSCRSHTDPLYAANRMVVFKALMKRTYACYGDVMLPTVLEFCDSLKVNGKKVSIVDEMHHITTALFTRVAFDERSDQFDKDLFECALWIINDTIDRPQNNFLTFLDWLPTRRNRMLKEKQLVLVNIIKQVIYKKKECQHDRIERFDVVSELLKNEINKDEDVLGILSIFFFAGFDTTSNAMTLVLHLLSENMDVQERCRDEIDDIIGIDDMPSIQKLHHLKYLTAVISETLRLFPTVPMIAREITEDHGEVCPRYDEENAFGVAINIFGLHCDEIGWVEPNSFVPERWLNKEFDANCDEDARLYCPFALGKRSCLGRQFAVIEMLTVLCMILQRFEIKKCAEGGEIEMKEAGSLVISPGYCLRFLPIDESELFEDVESSTQMVTHTREEVAKHDREDDIWIILQGEVYDITNFIARESEGHPGGNHVLLSFAGCDATQDFLDIGHSNEAMELLKEFKIGKASALEDIPIPNTSRRLSSVSLAATLRKKSLPILGRRASAYEVGLKQKAKVRAKSFAVN